MAYSPFFQPWRVNQFRQPLSGFAPGEPPPVPPSPKIPPPLPSPSQPPAPLPGSQFPNQPGVNYVLSDIGLQRRPALTPPAAPKPKLEVSPFLSTVYKSIQNIDPELRAEYLQTTAASIKERLDRFEFRLARGIPLTPEQQRQYDSIRSAYNDIQKYINNPTLYDEYLGKPTPQATPQAIPPRSISKEEFLRDYGRVAKARIPGRGQAATADERFFRLTGITPEESRRRAKFPLMQRAPGISISREEYLRAGGRPPPRKPPPVFSPTGWQNG